MNMEYKFHELPDSPNNGMVILTTQLDGNHMDIKAALEALEPNDRAIKWSMFNENYDYIEAALTRNVTKTKILAALALKGLKLSTNTFNKMLEAERVRRKQPQENRAKSDDSSTDSTDEGSQEARHD